MNERQKRPIRKLDPNNKLEQQEAQEYIEMLKAEMKNKYFLKNEEVTQLMKISGFNQLFQEDPYFYFHYHPEYVAEMIYNSKR